MANQRKMTIKERAQWLWAKHKGKVLILATMLGIGICLSAKNNDRELRSKNDDPAKETKEPYADPGQADPDRRLGCGGWILENDMSNKKLPLLIANDVPVSALGEFGQELIKLAEGKDLGDFNQDLENAWTSIIINLETPYAQEREEKKEEAA